MRDTNQTEVRREAYALLAALCERYPRCFKHEDEAPEPLKVGIFDDVRAAAKETVSLSAIKFAIAVYTRRPCYRESLAKPGAVRLDLNGHSAGKVAPEHREFAKSQCKRAGQKETTQ